ncbi:MAG: hypothetical protein ACREED_04490 [Stellaceae bacterium]
MLARLISSAGLLLNILGAALLTWDLILTKTEALELARRYFPEPGEDTHEIRKPSHTKESLRASRNAQIGLALMILGFCGQLVGTWLGWWYP